MLLFFTLLCWRWHMCIFCSSFPVYLMMKKNCIDPIWQRRLFSLPIVCFISNSIMYFSVDSVDPPPHAGKVYLVDMFVCQFKGTITNWYVLVVIERHLFMPFKVYILYFCCCYLQFAAKNEIIQNIKRMNLSSFSRLLFFRIPLKIAGAFCYVCFVAIRMHKAEQLNNKKTNRKSL